MTISIVIEPTASGFRADTAGPLNLSAEAGTSGDAIAALQAKIAHRLQNGTMIVDLPVPRSQLPIAGMRLAEHPLFDEWLTAVHEYRKQREAEEEALEQAGN